MRISRDSIKRAIRVWRTHVDHLRNGKDHELSISIQTSLERLSRSEHPENAACAMMKAKLSAGEKAVRDLIVVYNICVKLLNGGRTQAAEEILKEYDIFIEDIGISNGSATFDVFRGRHLLGICQMKRGAWLDAARTLFRCKGAGHKNDIAKCVTEAMIAAKRTETRFDYTRDILLPKYADEYTTLFLAMSVIRIQLRDLRARVRHQPDADTLMCDLRRDLETVQDELIARAEEWAVQTGDALNSSKLLLYKAETYSLREMTPRESGKVDLATVRDLGAMFSKVALSDEQNAQDAFERARKAISDVCSSTLPNVHRAIDARRALSEAFYLWNTSCKSSLIGCPEAQVVEETKVSVENAVASLKDISIHDLAAVHDECLIPHDRTMCDFFQAAADKIRFMGFEACCCSLLEIIHKMHKAADAHSMRCQSISVIKKWSIKRSFSAALESIAESSCPHELDCILRIAEAADENDFADSSIYERGIATAEYLLKQTPACASDCCDDRGVGSLDAARASLENFLKRALFPRAIQKAEAALKKRTAKQCLQHHAESAQNSGLCEALCWSLAQVGRLWEIRGIPRLAMYYYTKGEEVAEKLCSPSTLCSFLRMKHQLSSLCEDCASASQLGKRITSIERSNVLCDARYYSKPKLERDVVTRSKEFRCQSNRGAPEK